MAHEERELRDVSELALVISRIQLQVVEVISKRMANDDLVVKNFLELTQNQ